MRRIYTLLLSLFLFTACNGQITPSGLQASIAAGIDPYFVETTDTISAYGPNHITRDILQDRAGHFWLATWHGIIEYDGKLFTNHTLKDGLIHFHVLSIFEDSKGNLWFGTVRGGLYRYVPSATAGTGTGLFTLFTTKDCLADNTITCMAEDKEGHIWFGTDAGATRYDPSGTKKGQKRFTNFTVRDGLSGNRVNAIIQDRAGKLWFGTDDGISCYNGKSFTDFTDGTGAPVKKVTALLEDRHSNVWIGTFDGLTIYNPKASGRKGVEPFTHLLSNFLTYYIIEDKQGNIWLSHSELNTHDSNLPSQVLYRYDGKTFTKVIEKYNPNDFQVFGKTVDRSGNLWFGTMHGPIRYDPSISLGAGSKAFTSFAR